MKIEGIKIGINKEIDSFKITAEEGMVLRRKSDKQVFGEELTLGYTWYLGGVPLAKPLMEIPSDYEEVEAPQESEEERNAREASENLYLDAEVGDDEFNDYIKAFEL